MLEHRERHHVCSMCMIAVGTHTHRKKQTVTPAGSASSTVLCLPISGLFTLLPTSSDGQVRSARQRFKDNYMWKKQLLDSHRLDLFLGMIVFDVAGFYLRTVFPA